MTSLTLARAKTVVAVTRHCCRKGENGNMV